MLRFVPRKKNHSDLPDYVVEGTIEIMEFIRKNLDIYISFNDTYELWSDISYSWSAGWLSPGTHPEGSTREEFLLSEMEKRGYLVEE